MAIDTDAIGVLLVPNGPSTILYVVTPLDTYPGLAPLHALANSVDATAQWAIDSEDPILVIDVTGPIEETVRIAFREPAYQQALYAQGRDGKMCTPIVCASKSEVERSVEGLLSKNDRAFLGVGIGVQELEFPTSPQD